VIEGGVRPAAPRPVALLAVITARDVGRPLVGVARETGRRRCRVIESGAQPGAPCRMALVAVVAAREMGSPLVACMAREAGRRRCRMIEGGVRPAAARPVALFAVVAALYMGRPFIGVARETAARCICVVEASRTPAPPRDVALGTVVAALYMRGRFPRCRPVVVAQGAVAGNGGVVHLDELKPAVLRVALVALPPGLDVPHGFARRDDLAALRMAAVALPWRSLEGASDVAALAPCLRMSADEDKARRVVIYLSTFFRVFFIRLFLFSVPFEA